jgi:hypothetical protein
MRWSFLRQMRRSYCGAESNWRRNSSNICSIPSITRLHWRLRTECFVTADARYLRAARGRGADHASEGLGLVAFVRARRRASGLPFEHPVIHQFSVAVIASGPGVMQTSETAGPIALGCLGAGDPGVVGARSAHPLMRHLRSQRSLGSVVPCRVASATARSDTDTANLSSPDLIFGGALRRILDERPAQIDSRRLTIS